MSNLSRSFSLCEDKNLLYVSVGPSKLLIALANRVARFFMLQLTKARKKSE
jgi:hypothetical protein